MTTSSSSLPPLILRVVMEDEDCRVVINRTRGDRRAVENLIIVVAGSSKSILARTGEIVLSQMCVSNLVNNLRDYTILIHSLALKTHS